MCGPLVTLYAGQFGGGDVGASRSSAGPQSRLTHYEIRQHLLFNVGRATSYAVVGAVLGAIGGAVFVTTADLTAVAGTVRGVVGVGVGAVVVAIGVKYILGGSVAGGHLPGLDRVTGWLTGYVERLADGPGIVALGALHGLLPCPILYPAYLYAFASGSAVGGGLALGALGVGTIPAVLLYGTVVDSLDVTRRRRLHRVLGVVFLALGYVLLAHGLMALGIEIPHPMLPHYQPLA
jgi:sulfite exporter TauE/SafE